jgi:hypothetical protein
MAIKQNLLQRLVHLYSTELKTKLVELAGQFFGSLSVIGRPAGLYRNIGSGVSDFFYEVMQ